MLPKPQFSGLAVLLVAVALCACSQPSIETQIYRPDGRKHVPEFHLDIKRPDLTEWFQQPPWDPNTRVDGFPTQGFLAVRSGAAQPDELWQVGRPQISDRLLQFRLIVRNQNTTTTAHGVLASIELDFTTRAT